MHLSININRNTESSKMNEEIMEQDYIAMTINGVRRGLKTTLSFSGELREKLQNMLRRAQQIKHTANNKLEIRIYDEIR